MECDAIRIEECNKHILQAHGRIFEKLNDQYFKKFMDDINIHNSD
jgi:hypothetical protein